VYNSAFNTAGHNPYAAQDKRILEFEPFNVVLQKVQRIAPNKYITIAGGAVRDLYVQDEKLIKDIDVFILDVKDNAEKQEIIANCSRMLAGGPQHQLYPGANFNCLWNTAYPNMDAASFKAWGFGLSGKNKIQYAVQIVGHAAKDVKALLEDFDWRACQFAYDGHSVWRDGLNDFYENRLHLGNVRNAFYTLKRGFYLEHKFAKAGMRVAVAKEDMLTLASMMLIDPEIEYNGR